MEVVDSKLLLSLSVQRSEEYLRDAKRCFVQEILTGFKIMLCLVDFFVFIKIKFTLFGVKSVLIA